MKPELYREMAHTEDVFWWFRARRRILLQLLERYAPGDPSILDLGCGTGFNIQWLSMFYTNVRGMESSDTALKMAETKKLNVRQGRLPHNVPFDGASFDAVLLMDVLEHIDEDGPSVEKSASLLKKGGIIIATVPAHPFIWGPWDRHFNHRRRYSKASLESIFKLPSLEKILLSYLNSFLLIPIMTARLFSRIINTGPPKIKIPPPPINRLLEEIFALDGYFLKKNIPIITGASLIAVFRKK